MRPFSHRVTLLCLALTGVMVLSAGCGAVTSTSTLTDAQRQLDEAKGAEADKYAVYEFTRASSYLQKAKKLAGEGLYEQASEYARVSQTASDKSIDVARLNKDRESRKAKFAPKQTKDDGKAPKDDGKPKMPSFTPGGE